MVEKYTAEKIYKNGEIALKVVLGSQLELFFGDMLSEKGSKPTESENTECVDSLQENTNHPPPQTDTSSEEKSNIELESSIVIENMRRRFSQIEVKKDTVIQKGNDLPVAHKGSQNSLKNQSEETDKTIAKGKSAENEMEELTQIVLEKGESVMQLTERAKIIEDRLTVNSIESTDDRIQEDTTTSQDELERIRQDFEKQVNENDEMLNDYLEADDERERLATELAAAKDELEALKNKLDQIELQNTLQNDLINLNVFDQTESFESRLKQIVELIMLGQQHVQKQMEFDDLKKRFDENVNELKKVCEALTTHIQDDEVVAKELEDLNTNLVKANESLSSENQKLKEEKEKVEATITLIKAQNASLTEGKNKIEDELKQIKEAADLKVIEHKAEVEKLNKKTSDFQQEIERLQNHIKACEERLLVFQEKEGDDRKEKELQIQIDSLKAENQSLITELKKKEADLEEKIDQFSKASMMAQKSNQLKVRELESQIKGLNAEKQIFQEESSNLAQENVELAQEKNEMVKKIQELENQMTHLATEKKTAHARHCKRVQELEDYIEQITTEKQSLQDKLSAKHKEEVERAQRESEKAQLEHAQTKQLKEELAEATAELEKLRATVKRLETESNLKNNGSTKIKEEFNRPSDQWTGERVVVIEEISVQQIIDAEGAVKSKIVSLTNTAFDSVSPVHKQFNENSSISNLLSKLNYFIIA